MLFDRIHGSATLASDWLDPGEYTERLAELLLGLNRIAPAVFPSLWMDQKWHIKTRGVFPEVSVNVSEAQSLRPVIERGMREANSGKLENYASDVLLRSSGLIPYQMRGRLGGYSGFENSILIMVDPALCLLTNDRNYLHLDANQVRRIVVHVAGCMGLGNTEYEAANVRDTAPQVDRPPLVDIAARRKAVGPRWTGVLGWFTYLDASAWPLDVNEAQMPPEVIIEPELNGVTIQLGEDPENVSDVLIAQTRRAIGWEYRRDLLPD